MLQGARRTAVDNGGVLVHVAGEICVQSLVTRDELIGEREPRHEAPLFQPEDRTETSAEEDPLYTSKCYNPLCKRIIAALQPHVTELKQTAGGHICCTECPVRKSEKSNTASYMNKAISTQ